MYNTLETARKYLNGRVEEVKELDWRSYAPAVIASKIKGYLYKRLMTLFLKVVKTNPYQKKITI